TGSTLSVTGTYTQTAGATVLQDGTLAAAGTVQLQGGLLAGSGTLAASVVNAAMVQPGGNGAAGILTIAGDYTQTGVLEIELGGTTPGDGYDQLNITGKATFAGGTLSVSLINGFIPDPSGPDTFQILTFGAHDATDDFAVYTGLDLGGGLMMVPVFD